MKKILSVLTCVAATVCIASCGGKVKVSEIERISPDTLITAENASALCGVTLKADENGITNDGSARSVTYVPDPIGSDDPVTVKIEQFSESLMPAQVWNDYENSRVRRSDMEFVEGIGEDCYIAYPYINVYDRGCYIRISAGSGGGEEQKELLKSLATAAAEVVENTVPAEAAEITATNVIK